MPEVTPETRSWRTQVRVEKAHPEGLTVVLPAWDHRVHIVVPRDQVSDEAWQVACDGPTKDNPGPYLHARVNIGADRKEDLRFEDWEPR